MPLSSVSPKGHTEAVSSLLLTTVPAGWAPDSEFMELKRENPDL